MRDGEIIAAAQEERFSRKRHNPRFPRQAVNYCLGEAFIPASELDAVVFYDSPLLTFDRVVKNAVSVAPRGGGQFVAACRSLLAARRGCATTSNRFSARCRACWSRLTTCRRAASAFYPSPFDDAAILTIDGVGEWCDMAGFGVGKGRTIELISELRYPHSLSLLQGAFTYYCGFKVNWGQVQLDGAGGLRQPRLTADLIREKLVHVLDDGRLRLDTELLRLSPSRR